MFPLFAIGIAQTRAATEAVVDRPGLDGLPEPEPTEPGLDPLARAAEEREARLKPPKKKKKPEKPIYSAWEIRAGNLLPGLGLVQVNPPQPATVDGVFDEGATQETPPTPLSSLHLTRYLPMTDRRIGFGFGVGARRDRIIFSKGAVQQELTLDQLNLFDINFSFGPAIGGDGTFGLFGFDLSTAIAVVHADIRLAQQFGGETSRVSRSTWRLSAPFANWDAVINGPYVRAGDYLAKVGLSLSGFVDEREILGDETNHLGIRRWLELVLTIRQERKRN